MISVIIKFLLDSAIPFIRAQFPFILIAVLSLYAYWQHSRYEDLSIEYASHIAEDARAVKLAEENKVLIESATRKAVDIEVQVHRDIIDRLQVNNEDLKQKVGNLYANKTNADFRLASYADRMLLETGGSGTGAESAGDPERVAACRRELNAADSRLSIVEEACAVTTADFNLARGWIDGVCLHHKCIDKAVNHADD